MFVTRTVNANGSSAMMPANVFMMVEAPIQRRAANQ
jgi:hypothetical protein